MSFRLDVTGEDRCGSLHPCGCLPDFAAHVTGRAGAIRPLLVVWRTSRHQHPTPPRDAARRISMRSRIDTAVMHRA